MQTEANERIVIVGLSDHPDRFAYRAAQKLQKHGYKTLVGIHPSQKTVLDVPVVAKASEIKDPVHTLTMYVGPSKSVHMVNDLLALKPKRIIFNPGSECKELADAAKKQNVEVREDCTLVMLNVGQF